MIGIDIAKIDRFKGIKEADFKHWRNFFSKNEWKYCFSKPRVDEHLAAIFSIKESVMKAVGDYLVGRFDLISVEHDEQGRPEVFIEGKLGIVNVSVSHESGLVVTVAITI